MTDTLGIIGGMGPMAGAYFCQRLTEKTLAEKDAEHINFVLYSYPKIPDRTAYLYDNTKPSPAEDIIRIGRDLAALGCKTLAITCITSHALYGEFAPKIDANILHLPMETAKYLADMGVKRVGLMATSGTVKTGVFEKALAEQGIECIVPEGQFQEQVMQIIYEQVKAGKPVDMPMFNSVCSHLVSKGAEKVILGCTELSLVFKGGHPAVCVDALDALAIACIKAMGKQVRE